MYYYVVVLFFSVLTTGLTGTIIMGFSSLNKVLMLDLDLKKPGLPNKNINHTEVIFYCFVQ